MRPLSPRQREALEYISRYRDARGYSPTVREIADELGIVSTNGVNDHLRALERKGAIRRTPGIARSIVVLRTEEPS